MSEVIQFKPFLRRDRPPVLVLIDLQEGFHRSRSGWIDPWSQAAIVNCQAVLKRTRELNGPIAFVRRLPAQEAWSTRWLNGFAPDRSDMVFERRHPSCYASEQFAEMAEHVDGDYVLAGLFGESACLATAIDACHRGHRPTFLVDASTSRAAGELSESEVHQAVTAIVGLYADIVMTRHWVDLVLGGMSTSTRAGLEESAGQ